MALNSSKKLALGLGVASVAAGAGAGSVAVQAGPALQTLNNITNTAEFTINNTYGQSFSVDGQVTSALTPFALATGLSANFNALTATLTTGFTVVLPALHQPCPSRNCFAKPQLLPLTTGLVR